jgi:hypothetical protein
MAARKVVLGAELSTRLPPRKDPRVDSPEPFPAVIPGPDPVPSFRPSRMPHVDKSIAKWIAIATGAITVIGACTATVGKVWQELKPRTDAIEALRSDADALRARIDALEDIQTQHLQACQSFREASASAWRSHPNGEVRFRGVDGSIRLDSKSVSPPVSEVAMPVAPLPKAP